MQHSSGDVRGECVIVIRGYSLFLFLMRYNTDAITRDVCIDKNFLALRTSNLPENLYVVHPMARIDEPCRLIPIPWKSVGTALVGEDVDLEDVAHFAEIPSAGACDDATDVVIQPKYK